MQYAVGMQYTVGMQYAVGVSAKRSTHTVGLSKYGWWGPLPLVQKGQTHTVGYTVRSMGAVHSSTVTFSAKRSNTTVGDCSTQ